jgi:CHAT domain-containing protein/TolB-like protein/ketosteroid isomerase-like protein
MPPPPIYLTVLRKGDTIIVDLVETGSLIPRSETQVNEAFLQDLAAEVAHLMTPGYSQRNNRTSQGEELRWQTNTAVRDLQRIGGLIFSHLLTEPARKKLRAAEPCELYLRLDEQIIHVPWELCYDGNDFLATKFRVGRQVITGHPIPDSPALREASGLLRVLLIADPTESLPEAGEEADRLCELLDQVPGTEVTVLGGKGVRRVSLLAQLQTHDIVHFAGHSFYDAAHPGQSGWRLHEGVLTADELSKLTCPPLLVFSNSCQAGTTTGWAGNPRYEGQAFGIGSAFLLAGVKNYIGTFWVVHDEESVLFAATFYRGLTAGLSLGEALLQARQEILTQRGAEGLTWAGYMLYGDPACTLLPVRKTPLHLDVRPSEKTERGEQRETSGGQRRRWPWQPYLRPRVSLALFLIFAAMITIAYQLDLLKEQTQEGGREIAVGVMDFEAPNRADLAWMQQAIRTYLNSQLSGVPGLKVYSKEQLDFLSRRKSATPIEIAQQLHIAKIISGRFDVIAEKLFIEAHIVDVQTGIQEGKPIRLQGTQEDFFTLQQQIAAMIVSSLGLTVPPKEKRVTREALPSPRLDTYRLLLDAEGETSSPRKEDEPHSGLRQWREWLEVRTAWADNTPQQEATAEEEIRQVLEKYRQAYEAKDLSLLESVYDALPTAQKEAIAQYFRITQDLQVTLRDVDIAVQGNEAAVSCTREDEFTDTETKQKVKLDARFTKIFVRLAGTWKIVAGKK